MDTPPGPIGSPEYIEWIKNRPRHPRTEFGDAVEDKVEQLTGENLHMLFAHEDAKYDSDFSRILEIIHDFYDDNVSVNDTAQFIKEFLVAHKYI
jgi:hypothetical protein